jgi:glycosyltransferase involved in cell wall biosynthesis
MKDVQALQNLALFFRRTRFDVVLTVTPKAGFLGMIAAWKTEIPHRIHVFTGQVWHTKTGFFKKLLMAIDRITFHLSTRVFVDGKAQREFLIEKNIINDRRSFVLGKGSISGVDVARFSPDPEIRKHWRKELGYGENDVVFMFLGRLNVDKGIRDLARAFSDLSASCPDARLLLVGYDEEQLVPEILKMVSHPERVCFFGPTSKPNELLQVADVFCLPSYREGFGTSIIEASLLKKPIICSDTYGLQETIVDGVTGLRHLTANPASLQAQMEVLYGDKDAREEMGENGRKYVMEHFTAETISKAWLEHFQALLGVTEKPA